MSLADFMVKRAEAEAKFREMQATTTEEKRHELLLLAAQGTLLSAQGDPRTGFVVIPAERLTYLAIAVGIIKPDWLPDPATIAAAQADENGRPN